MTGAALARPRYRGPALVRIALGRPRLLLGALTGLVAYAAIGDLFANPTRFILAWDAGTFAFLAMIALMVGREHADRMAADAARQQEGEWIVFFFSVVAIAVSFAAIVAEFSTLKDVPAPEKRFHVALVALTLVLSWLTSQTIFALRYAHEYYTVSGSSGDPDGGLEFPSEPAPDYLDFGYFAIVLGMTFQVSDVQITSRKLRRLATLHGLIGFLFNTIILALTVNIASGLLS